MDELTAVEQAISGLEGQRSVLGDLLVDTALEPLLQKRDRLLAAAAGDQRRLVTVLFGDLVDSTTLGSRLDPEDLRGVMERYFAVCRAAIQDEGGVVEKFIGDAVMAVFGLYRAREDDPHRAVRAALAMRSGVEALSTRVEAEHGVPVRMRVGIDTGEVLATRLDQRDTDLAVIGETVNRAARLEAASPPGGILLSSATCGVVRGSFALTRVEGVRLKGLTDQADAYLVVSGTTSPFWPEISGVGGVPTRTIGRDVELGVLQKAFADTVEDRRWQVVCVLGDAGVGKSRLVHDFDDWLASLPDGVWSLRGRASPATEGVPNALLRTVLTHRLQITETDDPAEVRRKWHDGVAALLGGGDDARAAVDVVATWLGFSLGALAGTAATAEPETVRRRASATVHQLLAALAEQAPVVLLLEDLHWADAASLDWLEEQLAAPPRCPVLVVVTTRPALLDARPGWDDLRPPHRLLRVEPLSRREARALVAEVLRRADRVPDALTDLVVDAADGNPFYVEELLKWLVEEGVVRTGPDRWSVREDAVRALRVPTTLRGVLQARLDGLPRPERGVVARASVIGRTFWDAAVAGLTDATGEVEPDDALTGLRTREVVVERPASAFPGTREFSFKHALLRDVAYESVVRSERRRYHRLAARWLQSVIERSQRPDEHAAALGRHYDAAGDPAPAAAWYLRAGRHAARSFAGADALRLLERARELVAAEDVPLRGDVLLAMEEVLDRLGRRPEQRAVLDELAALAGLDDGRRAAAELAESRRHFVQGRYGDAARTARAAAGRAREAGRDDLERQALLVAGRGLAFDAEHTAARAVLQDVLERALQVGDHRATGEAQRMLGVVATNLAEFDLALRLLADGRAAMRRAGDLEGEGLILGQIGAVLYHLERLDEARVATEDALQVFTASGHRLRQGTVLGNLGTIAQEQGRLHEARRWLTETIRLAEEIDDPEGMVSAQLGLADVLRLTGDRAGARQMLGSALEVARRQRFAHICSPALSSLALVDLAEGRTAEALAHAQEGREQAETAAIPQLVARSLLVAGRVLVADGDAAAVTVLTEATRGYADVGSRVGWVESGAALACAQGELGGDQTAAAHTAAEVLAALEDGVDPGWLEPGRAYLDCWHALRGSDPPAAARVARLAAAFLEAVPARIGDEHLSRGFLSTPTPRALAALVAPLGGRREPQPENS